MYLLPPLAYATDALRPVIGEETMHTHHGKHHARYVHVVNVLLGDRAGASALEDVIVDARERGDRRLFNNAAQAWNHAFFWESMAPIATAPAAPLRDSARARWSSRRAPSRR